MRKRTIAIIAMVALVTQAGCCTVIGLGVGAATDHAKPHGNILPEE